MTASPADYDAIANELLQKKGEISRDTRWRLAQKAFATTAAYDSAIASTLEQLNANEDDRADKTEGAGFPQTLRLSLHKKIDLRYGTGLHDLVFARPLWATTASFSSSSSFSIFLREVELPSEDDDEKEDEDEDLAANYFLRCKEYGSPD